MENKETKPLVAAFFDVDGTIINSNVVYHYLYLATKDRIWINRWIKYIWIAFQVPLYLILDSIDRSLFNKVFYRNYRDMSVAKSFDLSQDYFNKKLCDHIFPSAIDYIIKHQKQGNIVVLVTGSLNFIIKPLADFLKVYNVISTHLKIEGEHYTGEIIGIPLAGEEKLTQISNFAKDLNIDLSKSYAYGDSIADLFMLNGVGNPVVINPEKNLQKIAIKKDWNIEYWN